MILETRALILAALLIAQPALAEEVRIDAPGHVTQIVAGETSLSAFYQQTSGGLSVDMTIQILGERDLRSRVILRDGQEHAVIITDDEGGSVRFSLYRQGGTVVVDAKRTPVRTARLPVAMR